VLFYNASLSEVPQRRVHASQKGVPSAVVWTVRR